MDQAVRNRKLEVLGRAVFGTASGLFADGDGVLDGASEYFSIFEFGRGFDRVDVLPQSNETIIFRRPAIVDHRQQIDLLGVLQSALDASNRPGYLGACVAAPPGEIGPYGLTSDWESAYREALRLLENVKPRLLDRDGKMRAVSSVRIFTGDRNHSPRAINLASDRSEISVYWRSALEPLTPEDYDLFQALSIIPGSGLMTTVLVEKERPGVIGVRSPQVRKIWNEYTQHLEYEKIRTERQKRESIREQESTLILSESERTGEKHVSGEHRDLLHRISELEYDVEELRSIVRALQREFAGGGKSPKYHDQFEYRQHSRFSAVRKVGQMIGRKYMYFGLAAVFIIIVVSFAIGFAVDTGLIGGDEAALSEGASQR